MWLLRRFYLFLSLIVLLNKGLTQSAGPDTSAYKIIAAGPEYKKSNSYQKLWGRNRRVEWTIPVSVPFLWLNSLPGEIRISESEGGNETKVLRVRVNDGKEREYTLRSINKSRDDVVPKEFKKTFVEDHTQDGVSMSHPYGAYALPVMEQHAGIYHTNPKLVYLPKQAALDSLNEKFGNDLYMFEQRLSGDWSEADNLGNFKDFIGTDELVDSLKSNNNIKADQHAFVTARLFDMMLADWDRHEDQWKWGAVKTGDKSVYKPIPRDRDQVLFTHDGLLIDFMLSAIGNGWMQNFDYDSKNISALNYEERNIDPFFTNEMTLEDWLNAARSLQQSLTDNVIEQSIGQMPPGIVAASGEEDIAKLKSRRDRLVKYATEYYLFLAKEVEITGSKKREYFEIETTGDGDISVKIFTVGSDGKKNDHAFYSRMFKPAETRTIRIYGIAGEDKYTMDGNTSTIRVSIIGGPDKDEVIQHSNNRICIYDDHNNVFQTSRAKLHLSSDSSIHRYDYYGHEWNKKGFVPAAAYNDEDRFYVGLGYGFTKYKWRRSPFATKQLIGLNYSISQNALSATYAALFPNVIGKWNISLLGNYDAIRWANFFGVGNETVLNDHERNYFRIRSVEWLGSAGINRQFGKSSIYVSGFFQSVKIKADQGRYITEVFSHVDEDVFKANNYVGGKITYTFIDVNDAIVPTKGIAFSGNAFYFKNTIQKEFFQKYFGVGKVFVPVGNKFSLAIKAGAATVVCKPEVLNSARFYEHAVIGGFDNLRGFRLNRFWGQSSFYNNNELRFITNLRTHLLNAKMGLLVFFDDGRVWIPGETSNTIHTAYGAGVLFAPFNKMSVTFTYGISKESRIIQGTLNALF
ncbi:MAG: hypothetical protein ACHQFX_12925 [Chitinophagales bacterium]